MPETTWQPEGFFTTFDRFVETSETGPALDRMNARCEVLIAGNRDELAGARVLDLACHDGRFGFAALQHGAAHVVGIDHKAHLVSAAVDHYEHYGVEPDRYRFMAGNLYDCMHLAGEVDVVLCFGLLYHLPDHWQILDQIAALGPRSIIIDTHVSMMDGTIVELRSRLGASPPRPGDDLEGFPTPAALEALVAGFGWTWEYSDWSREARGGGHVPPDYARGSRRSMVVRCPEHSVPADVRAAAVEEVRAAEVAREQEAIAVAMVADKHGIAPQALRTWVRRAEREHYRSVGFAFG